MFDREIMYVGAGNTGFKLVRLVRPTFYAPLSGNRVLLKENTHVSNTKKASNPNMDWQKLCNKKYVFVPVQS